MMLYSIELGLRGLLRHPRTMSLSILTLALGLAAVMTMLTLLAMLQADPLPGISQNLYLGWVDARDLPKPGEPPDDNSSIPQFPMLKQVDVDALVDAHPQLRIGALAQLPLLQLSSEDGKHNESVQALATRGPILSMFGVPLLHGRYWTAQEEKSQAHVIILNKDISLKLFGDENGVGRDVRSGTTLFRVIGISGKWNPQPHFHNVANGMGAWMGKSNNGEQAFLSAAVTGDADVSIFGGATCDDPSGNGGLQFGHMDLPHCRWLTPWAELRTPQQVSEFRDGLFAFASDRHKSGAFPRPPQSRLYSVREWLQANNVVPDSVHLNLWLALGLLLLCMVNVAGLLAARFLRRSGELGVRRILGAPRRSIVVQCLVEAGAAGLMGGLLALPLTLFGLWVVRMQNQGYTDQAHLNPWLFIALLVLSALVGLLVGALPAWRAARLEPAMQVKSL
jgi:putative ABC transport system permease protein